MRSSVLGICLIFFLAFPAKAQTWTRLQSWGLDLETIDWIDQNTGFAAGENLIIKTYNGGMHWEEVDFFPASKILDIKFLNNQIGLAVGENGYLIRSTDSGENWNIVDSPTNEDIKGIRFFTEDIITIFSNSQILISRDLGQSWTSAPSVPNLTINDLIFFSDDSIFSVGNQGRLNLSANQSNSWSSISTGTNVDLNSIFFDQNKNGYLVGDQGTILKSVNFGATWQALNSGVSEPLNDIKISPINANIIISVGDNATAIRSTNGGSTFGRANLGNDNLRFLRNLEFIPETNIATSVGQDGYLIVSTNGGGSWASRLAGIRNNFSNVDFKSDQFGFLAGERGAVYVTGNAGASLIYRPLPEPTDIISADFWNTGFGYVSGANGKIFRTGNSARTWVSVPTQQENDVNGFYLFAPSVAYIAGSEGYISRSFDSGGTWDSGVISNTTTDLRDVTFFDFQVGFSMGDNGQISWSNGGNEWENLPKLTEENLNALAKVDSSTAIIVGDAGVILKGEEKALVWREIENNFSENINDVDFWDDLLGMAVGNNGLTIQTKDGGETWVKIPSGTRSDLHSVSIATPLIAYAVGEEGTFLNYTCTPPGALSEITGPESSCLAIAEYSIDEPQIDDAFIEWRVDGGTILEGQGTSRIQVRWDRVGRNAVLVSNENFCGNGETSFMEVLVSDISSVDKIEGSGTVCTGIIETYSIEIADEIDILWEVIGGEIESGQGQPEVSINWTDNGIQELGIILSNECGESEKLTLPVQVNSIPDQPSPIEGETLTGLGEARYQITQEEGVNYTWEISSEGGRIISGQGTGNILIEWEEEGEYTITVTPRNQCNEGEIQTLNIEVNIITSLEEPIDPGLLIYPNPSSGLLQIESDYLANWKSVEIWTLQGSLIRQVDLEGSSQKVTFENLPRGVLILRMTGIQGQIVRRIIVK